MHAGHVQHVEVADHGGQIAYFHIGAAWRGVDAVDHILRSLELVRADEHEAHVTEAAQGLNQGVHGTAEGQVAAQTHGQVGDTAKARL